MSKLSANNKVWPNFRILRFDVEDFIDVVIIACRKKRMYLKTTTHLALGKYDPKATAA